MGKEPRSQRGTASARRTTPSSRVIWVRALAVAALVGICLPGAVSAQVFFGSRPHSDFTVGPLFVSATVTPKLGPVTVDVFFSLALPPRGSGADVEQDIYLLWPGGVAGVTNEGRVDPNLARYVEKRGFTVIEEGRLALFSGDLYRMRTEMPPERVAGGAPFVTFVRQQGALGLTSAATWIRIPWTPKLVNRVWLMNLKFSVNGLVKPKQASWLEKTFWGHRHLVSLSFNDVRGRAVFPLYFEHRDRVIKLSEEPSQVLINFADADHLKIDQVTPAAASRKLSETQESTEVVSLFLERSEGLTPQVLTVQFGYFSWLQTWTPIIISMVFFVLGNLAGPLLRSAAQSVRRGLAARVRLGRATSDDPGKSSGVVLSRETLARIVPGETTSDEVLRLCGPNPEEHEQLGTPERRTLIYRGRRVVPRRQRTFGWLATVSHWDVEQHEVEIELERDRVRDVQANVRRSRLPSPESG